MKRKNNSRGFGKIKNNQIHIKDKKVKFKKQKNSQTHIKKQKIVKFTLKMCLLRTYQFFKGGYSRIPKFYKGTPFLNFFPITYLPRKKKIKMFIYILTI